MSVAGEGDVVIAEALAEVVRDGGHALTAEPRRVQAMMNDVLGAQARSHRAEVDAVVVAVEESVPEGLLAQTLDEAGAVDRLRDRGLDSEVAQFACAVWQYALGMLADDTLAPSLTNPLERSVEVAPPEPRSEEPLAAPAPERGEELVGQDQPWSPRRRVVVVAAVGVAAVLALLAGAALAIITDNPPSTGTTIEELALGDADVLAVAERLDLSDPDGPLPSFNDQEGSGLYLPDAAYQLTAKSAEAASPVSLKFGVGYGSDMTVTAEIDSSSAPLDAGFGVTCRIDGNNYYAFALDNDGAYSIARVDHGEATILTGDGMWVPSDKLDGMPDLSIIEARCVSDELSFLVGGELIDQVTDDTFASGDGAGVFVVSSEDTDATITVNRFDVTGYHDRSQVDDEEADLWEDFLGSGPPEMQRCSLIDARHMGIEPTPQFITWCHGIVFAQFDSGSEAINAFDNGVSNKGVKLNTVVGTPDCRSQSNVRQKPVRADPGTGAPATMGIACITDGDTTAFHWTDPASAIVGLTFIDPDARDFDPEVFSDYGRDWWAFTVGDAPE